MTSFLYVILAFVLGVHYATAAVMHSHSGGNSHKEREEDGAYSPRDRGHISQSGEHHSEFDHEAIIGKSLNFWLFIHFYDVYYLISLGSAKEADEYDHLSPEESKRRLAILLNKMDLNGDKQIDRNELKAWIMRSFKYEIT